MATSLADRVFAVENRIFAADRVAIYSAAVVICYAAFLAIGVEQGIWLQTSAGVPVANDFLPMWVAGRLTLEHGAASAYDWQTMLAAERAATGGAFENLYVWPYPPTFFFAAAAVAMLPFGAALVAWTSVLLVAFLAAVYAIVPRWMAPIAALASPLTLWNVAIGQNGTLMAALLGGSLACLETRPVLAGMLLGLLTYKPHFGLLFPLVLVLTGNWRAIGAAAATALALAAASWLAFGGESWALFLAHLYRFGGSALETNAIGWGKLQSVYGLLRSLGVGAAAAWSAHVAVALCTAAVVAVAWTRRWPYALKAALLSGATLVVTPYVFVYDLVALAVPVAFLVADGLRTGFFPSERGALVLLAAASLLMMPLSQFLPFGQAKGLMLVLCTMALIIGRILRTERRSRLVPSLRPEPG
jgi:arabinofuranan 3-O-arabinosyltransferase